MLLLSKHCLRFILFVAEVLKRAMMSLHLLNHSTIVTKSFVRRFITAFKCLQWSLWHAGSVSRCVPTRLLLGRYWCMTSPSIETSCGDCTCVVRWEREDGNCDEHKSYRKIIHLIHFWAEKATRRQHAKRGSEKGQKSRDDFIWSGKIFHENEDSLAVASDNMRKDIKIFLLILKIWNLLAHAAINLLMCCFDYSIEQPNNFIKYIWETMILKFSDY